MEQDTSYVCRLCLKPCQDFEVIEDSHLEIFDAILLHLNLGVSREPIVCKACMASLQNCFAYKTVSLQMEELLTAANGCIFCHKWTELESFVLLNSDQPDVMLLKAMMSQFYPELNQKNSLNPILCLRCYESLQENFNFIVSCLDVEQQIKKYCENVGTNNKGQIDLRHVINIKTEAVVYNKKEDTQYIKSENGDVEKIETGDNINRCDLVVKNEKEEDTVKIEETESDIPKNDCYAITLQNVTKPDVKSICDEIDLNISCEEVKLEDYDVCEVIDVVTEAEIKKNSLCTEKNVEGIQEMDINGCDVKKKSSYVEESYAQKCVQLNKGSNMCSSRTEDPKVTEKDVQQEKEGSITRNEIVAERTNNKEWWSSIGTSRRNMQQNQDFYSESELRKMITFTYVSGEKRYQCQVCKFITRAKCTMNKHMILHQLPSEVPIFKCDVCGFKTKHQANMRKHEPSHRFDFQRPKYGCDHCSDADSPDIKRYECYTCGYKSYHKGQLRNHIARHGPVDPATLIYTCDKCPERFDSMYKLGKHLISHVDTSKQEIFKCESCSFEALNKSTYYKHRETHRGPFMCAYCGLKTKYTSTLRRHTKLCNSKKTSN